MKKKVWKFSCIRGESLGTVMVSPEMVGEKVSIYNGKELKVLNLESKHVGRYLGELIHTKKRLMKYVLHGLSKKK